MSRRSLARSLELSKALSESRATLRRTLRRACRQLTGGQGPKHFDEILAVLESVSGVACKYSFDNYNPDKFPGGYPLFYWMLMFADKWVMRILSDANKAYLF